MTSARVVGRLAAVRGPAGVQRSGMLCARDARDRGVAVLRARCDELAMQSGYVAVRELLWGEVHRDWAYFAGPAQLAAQLVTPEGAGYEGPARSGRRAPSFALADVESRRAVPRSLLCSMMRIGSPWHRRGLSAIER